MLLLQGFSAFAATPTTGFFNNTEDTIIGQALALEQSADIERKEFVTVMLNQADSNIDPLSDNSDNTEQVIQAVNIEDDFVEITTIFPYKVMPDGELVNSFEYTPTQIARDSTNTTTFVDVTVTVVTTFAKYSNIEIATTFYRHGGIKAYWNSSESTVKVSNILVEYDSVGYMYQYPECTTASYETLSSYLINPNNPEYFISSCINQDNPVKGKSYYDADHTMSRSTVLDCANTLQHGGMVSVQLTYSVNGKNYVHDRYYYVYGGPST